MMTRYSRSNVPTSSQVGSLISDVQYAIEPNDARFLFPTGALTVSGVLCLDPSTRALGLETGTAAIYSLLQRARDDGYSLDLRRAYYETGPDPLRLNTNSARKRVINVSNSLLKRAQLKRGIAAISVGTFAADFLIKIPNGKGAILFALGYGASSLIDRGRGRKLQRASLAIQGR